MNVLHINMSLDPVTGGGTVERVRQLHQSMLQMEGIHSRILSVGCANTSALPVSEDALLLPCMSKRWYLPAPKLVTMYQAVHQADVIHLINHWTILNAIIYWMARLSGKPYIICPAGALPLFGRSQGFKRWYNRLVGRAMVKNSAAAIAIAEDEIEILKQYGVPIEHIQHIPNGVRPEDFSCTDAQLFRKYTAVGDNDYLLFVGRLNAIKGPDLLLNAFIELSSDFPDLHLVFAGPDGGMLDQLKHEAEKARLDNRIHFPGYLGGDLKSSAYHGASMLVVPSRQEAMSIVALEGAVCGIPVLLTDRCGFDVLAQKGAAMVVDTNSSTMARVICELMPDLDLRNEMGIKGQQLAVNSYSWDIAARRHIELFSHYAVVSESSRTTS